jgi:hypothetical protein
MDTFDWTKFNHKVVIKSTKKRMFGRFYYTVKYFCPGGRIIHTDGDIPTAIEERKMLHRHFNYGGSWRATRERLDEIDSAQLEAFKAIKDQYQDQIRLRVEEPYVTFYAETEEKLVELANTLKDWRKNISTVTRTTAAEKEILDRNCIIARTDPGYKYKIVLRDGTFKNKASLCGYLEQIKDQVRISDGVWRNLEKPYPFIWGAWIYANDPDIATMLNIIEAGIVSNIHEVVVVDKYSTCQTIKI